MREIRFRGKRIDNGEWVEGYFVKFERREIPEIYTGWNCYTLTPECHGIEPSTVGQYTGLTDRNGKKIFEDDVLNVHDQIPTFDGYDTDEITYNGKVMYIKNQGMYVCEGDENGNALCALNLDECEIIGNIHDNPELLEVTE